MAKLNSPCILQVKSMVLTSNKHTNEPADGIGQCSETYTGSAVPYKTITQLLGRSEQAIFTLNGSVNAKNNGPHLS